MIWFLHSNRERVKIGNCVKMTDSSLTTALTNAVRSAQIVPPMQGLE
jgi:hypothetical protein